MSKFPRKCFVYGVLWYMLFHNKNNVFAHQNCLSEMAEMVHMRGKWSPYPLFIWSTDTLIKSGINIMCIAFISNIFKNESFTAVFCMNWFEKHQKCIVSNSNTTVTNGFVHLLQTLKSIQIFTMLIVSQLHVHVKPNYRQQFGFS